MGMTGSTKNGQARLRALASVPARISRDVAARLSERLTDMYMSETDPYGRALAPLKASTIRRKKGNTVILYRTGKEAAAAHAKALPGAGVGIVLGPTAKYAHEGGPHRVPRIRLPIYGIPAMWKRDIEAAAQALIAAKGQSR